MRQVHEAAVVTVTRPGEHAGAEADAAVTTTPECRLAVRTADCAPIILVGEGNAAVGVIHAGWRGIVGGVVEAAAAAMRALGVEPRDAWVGPHIQAGCYEFGAADLDAVAAALGNDVRATTLSGAPALDVAAAADHVLRRVGIERPGHDGGCTACSTLYFSHRARGEQERFATVAWLED